MKTSGPLILISILCFGASAFAQGNGDDLKQRLVQAQSKAENDAYTFTRTVRNDVTAGGNAEQTVNVERYDPTKPAHSRWTLVSVNGAPPSARALRKFSRKAHGRNALIDYRLPNFVGSPAVTTTDAQGRTVLRYSNLPMGSVFLMGIDVSDNSAVDVVVSEAGGAPFAEEVHLSVKPMRMMLVMKLRSFEATSRYGIGADGRPLLLAHTSDVSASAFGFNGHLQSVATYTDYRTIGAPQ
jgi:hypothetical protein